MTAVRAATSTACSSSCRFFGNVAAVGDSCTGADGLAAAGLSLLLLPPAALPDADFWSDERFAAGDADDTDDGLGAERLGRGGVGTSNNELSGLFDLVVGAEVLL